ncbi:Armadillo-like helical domain containing protein [Gracilaria domingensis]|nr:Armadillo-like helical domain containing protein [Gracilaria domingensis]
MATEEPAIDENVEIVFCRKTSSRKREGHRHLSEQDVKKIPASLREPDRASCSSVLSDRDIHGLNKNRSAPMQTEKTRKTKGGFHESKELSKITSISIATECESGIPPKQDQTRDKPESKEPCNLQCDIPAQAPLTSIISNADGDAIVSEISGLGPEDLDAFHKQGGVAQCNTIISQTVESMESNLDDTRTLRNGLSSLTNLCADERSRTFVGNNRGIKIVIETLERHAEDLAIQELGMRFLARVSLEHPENQLQVGHRNGMNAILNNFSTRERVTSALFESCCDALHSICHKCEFNQTLAGSLKAPAALAIGLDKWRNDVMALEQCLLALNTLATNNSQNTIMICESGLGKTIVSIMEQYAAYLSIQTACFQLCWELLRRNPLGREELGKAGIIECIEGGLLKHAVAKKFIILSCNCLRYLAFTATNRQRIAECAIMPLLTASLERWSKCADVVMSILPAFANATYDNRRNKYAAARNGGIATMVCLLDTHESSCTICEFTCRVLRNISDGNVQTKRLCVRQDGIAGVISTMKHHLYVEGVHEHGCAMLINLLECYSHLIKSSGIEDHLNQVLEIHQGNARVERQVMFLQATLKRMPNTEPERQNSRRDIWFKWLGRNDEDESSGKLTRAASTWWFSSRENSLVHRESASSRGSTALRVGNTTLDAEDILKGEEIQKEVERLSNADSAVEY